MKILAFVMALSGLAVAGCSDTDWDHAMTYSGLGGQRVAENTTGALPGENTPPPSPTQTSTAPDTNFCESVAKQDATSDGLDAATQQRLFQRNFRQCIQMFGLDHPQPQGTMASRAETISSPGNGIR
ncbi:MAG TPA: hypothetical protein VHZ32_10235 [Rhizomicrobium sp.]|nr:hypothetical protein [Rhizomicrobium sp.]